MKRKQPVSSRNGGNSSARMNEVDTVDAASSQATSARTPPVPGPEDGFLSKRARVGNLVPSTSAAGGAAGSTLGWADDKEAATLARSVLKSGFEEFYDIKGKLAQDFQVSNPGQVQVLLATHRTSRTVRAVKVLNKSNLSPVKILAEVEMLARHNHPNVVHFYEAFEDSKHVYLCMELMRGGELFDQIVKLGRYTEGRAATIVRSILRGLKHVHDVGVAHCDLKPENILFVSSDPDSDVKIIDFGLAQRVCRGRISWLDGIGGTETYMSPERVTPPFQFTRACDVWSVGVVMFMLLTGFAPFQAQRRAESIAKIKGGFHAEVRKGLGPWFPEAFPISASAKNLLAQLLHKDAHLRLTPAEALKHPWLSGEANDQVGCEPVLKFPPLPFDIDVIVLVFSTRKRLRARTAIPELARLTSLPSLPRVRPQFLAAKVVEQLRSYTTMTDFQKAVCKGLSRHIPKGELYLLERAFKAADTDSDSLISIDEFRKTVARYNQSRKRSDCKLTEEELQRVFSNADVNKDSYIDYEELILACVRRRLMGAEERLWWVFSVLEQGNRGGRISTAAIAKALSALDPKGAKQMVKDAGGEKDGYVTYTQFFNMWKRYS